MNNDSQHISIFCKFIVFHMLSKRAIEYWVSGEKPDVGMLLNHVRKDIDNAHSDNTLSYFKEIEIVEIMRSILDDFFASANFGHAEDDANPNT
ncbi:hypothetical protein [Ensifer sp. NM-2]|uniref:hypothetical protein n=1 Tax=Ensifer sp. NM-2 TaxID=2109730 RepID=UPI000D13B5E0|nr:hypothetical protein [Ensifer sp. NM-2]